MSLLPIFKALVLCNLGLRRCACAKGDLSTSAGAGDGDRPLKLLHGNRQVSVLQMSSGPTFWGYFAVFSRGLYYYPQLYRDYDKPIF